MDEALARTLIELDCAFYRAHAASFSATRQAPWPGWQRVADLAGNALAPGSSPAVLDLACGNLRFERFLSERARGCAPVFFAVDSCPRGWRPATTSSAGRTTPPPCGTAIMRENRRSTASPLSSAASAWTR